MFVRSHAKWLSVVAIAAFASLSTLADAALSVTGGAKASFLAVGPAGMKIEGTTSDVSAQDDGTTVKVIVDLRKLDTGMSLRDKHMREKYLEVGTYPTAILAVGRGDLKFPSDGGETSGDAPGKLTVHGVTKDVKFHYSAKNAGGAYAVSGSFAMNMNDFAIEVPSYLGVTVKPNVDVSASFSAADR